MNFDRCNLFYLVILIDFFYMDIQKILTNDELILNPLRLEDFDVLFAIASDKLLWEQHPNRDRYKREVFEVFFEGAIQSKGAYSIIEKASGSIIGSSRYYDLNMEKNEIKIGYTFIARTHWGKGINQSLKRMMLEYIFQFVDNVIFHIGAQNIRSQKSIEKIGAKEIAREEVSYFGELPKLNVVYKIEKAAFVEEYGGVKS